jgi:hypothetical protein
MTLASFFSIPLIMAHQLRRIFVGFGRVYWADGVVVFMVSPVLHQAS